MKYFKVSFLLIIGWLLPVISKAQVSEDLIVCGKDATDMCDINDLIVVANNVIDVIIILALAFSVLVLLVVGAKYMLAGSSDAKSKAKESFVNLAKGFGFILGAWLIVNTLFLIAGVDNAFILFNR